MSDESFLTVKSLAEQLTLSQRTVREMIRTREIPSYKIAGARRIDPADVAAYLAERREERG